MKRIFYLFILILLIVLGCSKQSYKDNNEYYLKDSREAISPDENEKLKLPINYERLETFLGKNFIPVFSARKNFDADSDYEACIAYKINVVSTIKVAFFKFIRKNIIKKVAEIETEIYYSDSFVFQTDNLFYEDDISFIIEGKSIDDKNLLYIYSYVENEYKMIEEFAGDYSVIINYDEKEHEQGKYDILRDIETVDNYFSSTNTSIQQKKVYKWDYDENKFFLTETSKLLYSNNLVNPTIYSSEKNFLNYLNGFWYPEEYKELIDKNKIDIIEEFECDTIEFILFSSNDAQVSVKYEDYLNNYKIEKIKRLWGNRPGLRMKIDETSELLNSSKTDLEVYLMEANLLKVKGPNRYDERNYVRLPRPFIDYVNDIKEEKNKKEITHIINKLQREYKTDDDVILKFNGNCEYTLEKNSDIENGVYKITYDNMGYIISFLAETEKKLLPNNNFIIRLSKDSEYFTLVPVKIDLNSFVVDDIRSITFYKHRGRG